MGRLTTEDFLQRAAKVWGDRWNYSNTTYNSAKSPVQVMCRVHGEFSQHVASHLRGNVGCRECSSWKMSEEDFLGRATECWNGRWDYSKVRFINTSTKVKIKCKKHGEFLQTPKKHLLGNVGCPECNGQTMTTRSFIRKAQEIWEDRWDYSQVQYIKSGILVDIICREHGKFQQRPNNHLNGAVGCRWCKLEKGNTSLNTSDFIERSKNIWGDRWDYSQVHYTKLTDYVVLGCPDHGEFSQPAGSHFFGHMGCRKCLPVHTSSTEISLQDFIISLGYEVKTNVRNLVPSRRMEADIYIPSLNVAIEFNGMYWHSEKFKDPNYHYLKWNLFRQEGIKLIQIWEDDWSLRPKIVEEHIRQVLGVSTLSKVSARNTSVQTISKTEAQEFLNKYHIQGYVPSSVYLGLRLKGDLVAVATFKKSKEDYTLTRYATSAQVRGGHSKIISFFERNYSYRNLVTFADLTFGGGDLYDSTGWHRDKILPPDYSYLMRASNLLRVYDAGKIRFIKPHPTLERSGS